MYVCTLPLRRCIDTLKGITRVLSDVKDFDAFEWMMIHGIVEFVLFDMNNILHYWIWHIKMYTHCLHAKYCIHIHAITFKWLEDSIQPTYYTSSVLATSSYEDKNSLHAH